jgi:hypothetical protein
MTPRQMRPTGGRPEDLGTVQALIEPLVNQYSSSDYQPLPGLIASDGKRTPDRENIQPTRAGLAAAFPTPIARTLGSRAGDRA